MCNRSDSLVVSQTRYQPTIHDLEDASFDFDRGVGTLIENAPHVAVTFRGVVALRHSRALIVSRACANPRRELLRGRKCRCRSTYFGNDLLRRIHAQTGYLCQPPHGILMLAEQTRHFLVQLADLLLDKSKLLQ